MHDTVALILLVASLLAAAWAFVYVVLGRRPDDPMVYALMVLEIAFLALLVGGSIALARTTREVDGVSFVGYLVCAVLILPLAVVWAFAEKSRWGTAVLAVAGIVLAVLVIRLQDVWAGA